MTPDQHAILRRLQKAWKSYAPDDFSYEGLCRADNPRIKIACMILGVTVFPYDRGRCIEHLWYKFQNGLTQPVPETFVPAHWGQNRSVLSGIPNLNLVFSAMATDMRGRKMTSQEEGVRAAKSCARKYAGTPLTDTQARTVLQEFCRYYATMYKLQVKGKSITV